MSRLDSRKRARLPDRAFAYVDSHGRRWLPVNDKAHVKNALARFNQVAFENDAARERARKRLLNAAKKYRIVPVGFITGQWSGGSHHCSRLLGGPRRADRRFRRRQGSGRGIGTDRHPVPQSRPTSPTEPSGCRDALPGSGAGTARQLSTAAAGASLGPSPADR
jgi:hypothetical protein